ncbi:hypothetical protein Taro_051004 [Colocasia esculenta]|uniref:Uncharacterized protein n=1 Tax=Colocasia esculenta TaxID=4460 RepID=A0A843XFK2_COLES|nr:hypothetical protein [Colocasia esculenta]
MKIRQGGQTIAVEESRSPVAISSDDSSDAETVYGSPSPSGILSDDGSLFKERKRERISALNGIEGDSSSSGERSPVVTSRPEATASPELTAFYSTVEVTTFYSTVKVTAFYSTVEVTAFCSTVGVTAFHSTVGMTAFYFTVRMTAFYLTFTVRRSFSCEEKYGKLEHPPHSSWICDILIETEDSFHCPPLGNQRKSRKCYKLYWDIRRLRAMVRLVPSSSLIEQVDQVCFLTGLLLLMTLGTEVRTACVIQLQVSSIEGWELYFTPMVDQDIGAAFIDSLHHEYLGSKRLHGSAGGERCCPPGSRVEDCEAASWVSYHHGLQRPYYLTIYFGGWLESRLQTGASHDCTSTSSVDVRCSAVISGGGGGNHSSSGEHVLRSKCDGCRISHGSLYPYLYQAGLIWCWSLQGRDQRLSGLFT